jgi:predicted dehydrogenase
MPRLAIIGGGSIGTRHAQNLRTLGESDLLIIEPHPPRAEALAAMGFQTHPDLARAWEADIDAVLICSPTIYHREQLEAAISAGKHLFIEKPIAHTLEGVADLVAAARAKNLVGLLGYNMRFRDSFKRVQAMIAGGEIGRPLAARAQVSYYLPHYHPDKDYRTRYQAQKSQGGGVMLDDSHELDYLLALFGPVKQVYAQVGRLSDLEMDTEDYAGMMLTHESGIITQLQMDFLQQVYRRNLEITGSRATLTADFNTGELRLYGPADHQYRVFPQSMGVTVNQMYLDEMAHFLECLAGRARPIADLQTGYQVLVLAMAAFESSARGQVLNL